MTHASTSAHPVEDCGCDRPRPATPVLLHRNLVPDLNTQALSVFGDDRWDLTPGVFEAHTQVRSLDFADCPADLRSATKHYCWELINHTAPQSMRGASTDRLSLPTVSVAFRRLLPFLTWLRVHGITSFDQVTTGGLGSLPRLRARHGEQPARQGGLPDRDSAFVVLPQPPARRDAAASHTSLGR